MLKDTIILHHSASAGPDPQYAGILAYHNSGAGGKIRKNRGLAYTWFIGKSGDIKQAHSEEFVCDNSGNWVMNQRSIAICLAGDFTKQEPTAMQILSLMNLVTDIQERWGIPDERIIHHWEVTPKHTVCPRIDLRGRIFTLRSEKMGQTVERLKKALEHSQSPRKERISRMIDRLQKLTPTYPVSI